MQDLQNTLCLCMIVKNERKIIKRLLDSIIDYIDYYVICDTGSTDNTIEIVKEYMEKKNIFGEIYYEEWKSFGENRSSLLEKCHMKSDYLLLADADYEFIIKNVDFKNKLVNDGYSLKWISGNEYVNTKLISGKKRWKYVGYTHEFLTQIDENDNMIGKEYDIFEDIEIYEYCDGANRPVKFRNDIEMLKKELANPTKHSDIGRINFYLGNSYMAVGEYVNAINCYIESKKTCGWKEQNFYCLYNIGKCYESLNYDNNLIIGAYLSAYDYYPKRLESINNLLNFCNKNKLHNISYIVGKKIYEMNIKKPHTGLFIEKEAYSYESLYLELSVAAYYVGDYELVKKITNEALEQDLSTEIRELYENNYKFTEKIENNTN